MLWCEYWWLATFSCGGGGGFGGAPPRKFRNMKCSRSDSTCRHILVLLRVTLCSEPNIFLYNWLKHYIFHSEDPPDPPPPLDPPLRSCIGRIKMAVRIVVRGECCYCWWNSPHRSVVFAKYLYTKCVAASRPPRCARVIKFYYTSRCFYPKYDLVWTKFFSSSGY